MKRSIFAGALLLALAACGSNDTEGGAASGNAAISNARDGAQKAEESVNAPSRAVSQSPLQPKRQRMLESPDDDAMGWLAADWLGLDLPLDKWATERVKRRSQVDEFDTEEATKRELAQLREARAAGADIGRITMTLRGSLSEYDTDYGEFYLKTFTPGSVLTFRPFSRESDNPFSRGVELRFRNGGDASVWSVDAATAKKVADSLDYGRNVKIEATLTIADVTASDSSATILANVDSYDLYATDGRRLAHVDVGTPAGKAGQGQNAASPKEHTS